MPEASTRLPTILKGRLAEGMSFAESVWAVCSRVPSGKVTSYGAIAKVLGHGSPRAVGQALGRNPHAPAVPCHRVVAGDGRLTGYAGGLDVKRRLLREEGVAHDDARVARDFFLDDAALSRIG